MLQECPRTCGCPHIHLDQDLLPKRPRSILAGTLPRGRGKRGRRGQQHRRTRTADALDATTLWLTAAASSSVVTMLVLVFILKHKRARSASGTWKRPSAAWAGAAASTPSRHWAGYAEEIQVTLASLLGIKDSELGHGPYEVAELMALNSEATYTFVGAATSPAARSPTGSCGGSTARARARTPSSRLLTPHGGHRIVF